MKSALAPGVVAAIAIATVFAVACGGKTPARPAPAAAKPAADPALAAMIEQLDAALAKRPDDQVLLLLRAATGAQAGQVDETIAVLERLDASGWDVPFGPTDFAPLAADRRFQAIAARIAGRSVRVKRSELAFTIAGQADLIPEGIAVDAATGTFYVGSIHKRTIVAIERGGRVRTFVTPARDGLSAVLGLKVDGARGVLWATSFATEGMQGFTEAERGRSELTAFALADGSMRRRIAFPAGAERHLLNDIALAGDGTVYVTDSEAGAVWRVPPDRDVFEPVVPAGSFAYPNGIVRGCSDRLLVAHGTGIAVVDPAGTVTRLAGARGIPLGGIDGLLIEGRRLLAVQNGLGMPRLVAIDIDEACGRATALTVLENDPGSLEIPTTSTVFDGALYTIANSQLDALGPSGLRADRKLEDPRILRTPLR